MGNKQKQFFGKITKSRRKLGKLLAQRRIQSKLHSDAESMSDSIRSPSNSLQRDDVAVCSRSNADIAECSVHTPNDGIVPEVNAEATSSNVENDFEVENRVNLGSAVPAKEPIGRRIVNVHYFFKELQRVSSHGPLQCGLVSMEIVSEVRVGLVTKVKLRCKMCGLTFFVATDPTDDSAIEMDLNTCAVAGSISIGCGYTQLTELSATLGLPMMTKNVYSQHMSAVNGIWEREALISMNEAAKEERRLAIEEGSVNSKGIPVIDVIADGCWAKRSYQRNYTSLSGAAAIVGRRTNKILFMAVKNKYCSICAQAQHKEITVKEHICYKNYSGPSSGMESTIIVEGFKKSIDMHNLIYGRIISDGDSNTYSKLLQTRPYDNITIEKIGCRNHLFRNMCKKLLALQVNTGFLKRYRNLITKTRILSIRKVAVKAIREHKESRNVTALHKDILLGTGHAFGMHNTCKDYFCDKIGEDEGINKDILTNSIWQKVQLIVSQLAAHARSLICDVDSNTVERYHSVVAKFVGGKRINYTQRYQYQMRCNAAALSFNTDKALSKLHKAIVGVSPSGQIKKWEDRKLKSRRIRRKLVRRKRVFDNANEASNQYGENCTQPDVSEDALIALKEAFLSNLNKTAEEREKIAEETILQAESSEWLELRRSLLTSSNFGRVIKRKPYISCSNLVKDLLYKQSISHVASVKHGKDNEKVALNQLQNELGKRIAPCGLYIDEEIPYLGASPDGLTEDNMIVEVKCPVSAFKYGFDQARNMGKISFYKKIRSGNYVINENHNWYYQVQGQLHITRKNACLFAIWSGENVPIKFEIINRNDEFWDTKMKPKLTSFYLDCILPELVDSRFSRKMPIRDPEYIMLAIESNKKKMLEKRNKENCNAPPALGVNELPPDNENVEEINILNDGMDTDDIPRIVMRDLNFGEY